MVLDSQDRPRIAFGLRNGEPGFGYSELTEDGWTTTTFGDASIRGASLVIDASDNSHLAFTVARSLHYARRVGDLWEVEELESTPVGLQTSIVMTAGRVPHILYKQSGRVQRAWRVDDEWSIESLWPTADLGDVSLQVDGQDHLHAIWHNRGVLHYSTHDGTGWSPASIVARGEGRFAEHSRLAVQSDGTPHVSYRVSDPAGNVPAMGWYATAAGGVWSARAIPQGGDLGIFLPLPMGVNAFGQPHIALQVKTDVAVRLVSAFFNGNEWSQHDLALPNQPTRAAAASVALDSEGWPHIAYFHIGAEVRYAPPTCVQ